MVQYKIKALTLNDYVFIPKCYNPWCNTPESKKSTRGRIGSWKTNTVPSSPLQLCFHLLVEIHTSPSVNAASTWSQVNLTAGKAEERNPSPVPKAEKNTRRPPAPLSQVLLRVPGYRKEEAGNMTVAGLAAFGLHVKHHVLSPKRSVNGGNRALNRWGKLLLGVDLKTHVTFTTLQRL